MATWNVNSAKQRMPRLLSWLDQRKPDVVCLQETKLADDAFRALLGDELARRGYRRYAAYPAAIATAQIARRSDPARSLPRSPCMRKTLKMKYSVT